MLLFKSAVTLPRITKELIWSHHVQDNNTTCSLFDRRGGGEAWMFFSSLTLLSSSSVSAHVLCMQLQDLKDVKFLISALESSPTRALITQD
ncbi:Hypothetical predicted protein [Xyrichtys novacula]|uniref:Uncharacterized protein n=1 Tax=Xyrichtys novacula TaxID=13765 RepID=A0AAV1GBU1_XYRNO|nr:Hypothetical predicted protein [Xyrichtys novacula]